MYNLIRQKLEGKKVVLLGFGREGKASYSLIRKMLPDIPLTISDKNESLIGNTLLSADPNVTFELGKNYLSRLSEFDVILKSPGISLMNTDYRLPRESITSQTDLFLQAYGNQVIGITGTKGKSTTSSLIHHILKISGRHSLLLGNIGQPAFEMIDEITAETLIVFEMSSHQLEYITVAPHLAILLNLYQEHLDAYRSFLDYQQSKMNIVKYQGERDFFIYNSDDDLILQRIEESSFRSNTFPYSLSRTFQNGCFVAEEKILFSRDGINEEVIDLHKKRKLKGEHNTANIMAAVSATRILGIDPEFIRETVAGFTGLEHRLEYSGDVNGIRFYNDSIATIPESCMEAVKALGNVETLILGGFDRGIDYSHFAEFLSRSGVRNFIFTGEAGERMFTEFDRIKRSDQKSFRINHFDEFLEIAIRHTNPGTVCLLSPAAASYNEFQNFEMRGKRFKELVKEKNEMNKG
jgi:UDP-N-acetylmuramoyl-L-alanine---L-glutamate ligase